MLNKKDFLKYASTLAFPIMLQNLIGTLVNIADTVMLGYVSQTAMSASSLANQYTFILFCLYYGMATGTSVLCAQYWGKGDKKTVETILGLAERISLIISLIFFVISFTMPTAIMKIFTNSPETIAAGSEYLKVISFSFLFMGFSQIFMSSLRSIGKIMLPSVTYIVSLCVNVLCNASFIFGLFGLPKLGVTGVALGTVIARISEVLICLIYSLRSSDVRFRIKYFFAKSDILFQDFIKIATPAVINDVVWSFANSAFAAILGHISDDMVAANAVAVMVVNIGAIACRGFANATTIIVSQELGKDRIDTAREYGKRMLRITFIVSLIGCVVILAIRPMILDFYRDKLTETAIYYLGIFIIMTTWRFVGEGINTCLICGCFRGGGDTRFGMIVDTIFMWLVAVPLTFLAAYVLKLPPIWVYFIMTLDEFEKMPRKTRDILVSVIVPIKVKAGVYLSQRNQSTDFPVLTCAVAKREEGYVAAVGATPHLAENVWDKEGILTEINEESIEKFAAKVAEQIRFGSNMRAGAAYRRIVCQVLVKRALYMIVAENNGEEEKC